MRTSKNKKSRNKSKSRNKKSRNKTKSRKLKLVKIVKSPNPKKKYRAIFNNGKHTDFGAAGYSDYTKHKSKDRKKRYSSRHKKREHWNKPTSAGALSRYILWNKPTLKASIRDYKRRFKL